jgi:hypothetical protein
MLALDDLRGDCFRPLEARRRRYIVRYEDFVLYLDLLVVRFEGNGLEEVLTSCFKLLGQIKNAHIIADTGAFFSWTVLRVFSIIRCSPQIFPTTSLNKLMD